MTKIQTYTGRVVDLENPTPDMIDIDDIAHSLSMQVRFTGHIDEFYSVAQHCVKCAHLARNHHQHPIEVQRWALLHDASEAYIGDLSSPLKSLLSNAKEIEERFHIAIALKFDLPWPIPSEVHTIDRRMLATEQPLLMERITTIWESCTKGITPYDFWVMRGWSPAHAKSNFNIWFGRLFAPSLEPAAANSNNS